MKGRPILERFNERVAMCPMSGCWIWMGAHGHYGHLFTGAGESIGAHRVSWKLFRGPIPDGLYVLHRCDVPLCVNPHHLFLGTNLDNIKDRHNKGRDAKGAANGSTKHPELFRGEKNGRAKLTPENVQEIRNLLGSGLAKVDIARRYKVARTTIGWIARGQTWGHLLNGDCRRAERALEKP